MHEDPVKTAPANLGVMQAFVNTAYGQGAYRHEGVTSVAELRAWLVERRLLAADEPVTASDLRRVFAVRAALRAWLRANSDGEPLTAAALTVLNHVTLIAPLALEFQTDGASTLVPQIGGVDGALAWLLSVIPMARADGSLARLKVCRNAYCGRAFYDTSKNHSAIWCATATCGNRAHAHTFRRRHSVPKQDPEHVDQ